MTWSLDSTKDGRVAAGASDQRDIKKGPSDAASVMKKSSRREQTQPVAIGRSHLLSIEVMGLKFRLGILGIGLLIFSLFFSFKERKKGKKIELPS